MSIINKESCDVQGIIIDLNGSDGNAFSLMGTAESYCKSMGIDSKTVIKEMMSGDYENLISVFDSYFGSFVTLLR